MVWDADSVSQCHDGRSEVCVCVREFSRSSSCLYKAVYRSGLHPPSSWLLLYPDCTALTEGALAPLRPCPAGLVCEYCGTGTSWHAAFWILCHALSSGTTGAVLTRLVSPQLWETPALLWPPSMAHPACLAVLQVWPSHTKAPALSPPPPATPRPARIAAAAGKSCKDSHLHHHTFSSF